MNKLLAFISLFIMGTNCFAYNYQSTIRVPIKLSIVNQISSEQDVYEGQIVDFKVVKTVRYKNTIIKEGEIVPAKVKLVIVSGMNGIPASIVFDEFKIHNIPSTQITSSVEAFGIDRSLWVFPLKWALTPFPPSGSLTNFIKGGHAKVKPTKEFTIYYHPEW